MAEIADEPDEYLSDKESGSLGFVCWSITLQVFTEISRFFYISLQIFSVLRLRGLKVRHSQHMNNSLISCWIITTIFCLVAFMTWEINFTSARKIKNYLDAKTLALFVSFRSRLLHQFTLPQSPTSYHCHSVRSLAFLCAKSTTGQL